jgi:hypothetical protein
MYYRLGARPALASSTNRVIHTEHYEAIDLAARQLRAMRSNQDRIALDAVIARAMADNTTPALIDHAVLDACDQTVR